jgi:hypothetical protein
VRGGTLTIGGISLGNAAVTTATGTNGGTGGAGTAGTATNPDQN